MKPLLRRSDLTNPPRYYLLTRYRIEGDAVIASTKYDVTDQVEALADLPCPDCERTHPWRDHSDPAIEQALDAREAVHSGLREAAALVLRMEDEGRLHDNSGTGALDDLRAALRKIGPPKARIE